LGIRLAAWRIAEGMSQNGSDFAQIPNSLLLDYNSLLGIKFGNFNSLQDCVGNSAKIPSNISGLTVHLSA
jgi:hypothetical protein